MAKGKQPKTVKASAIIEVDTISRQRQLFVDHYIICMNATEAARRAGYEGDGASLATQGWRLLRNADVLDEIDRRLNAFTMSANEVLVHLTDIARGDIGDVMDSTGGIDPLEAKRRGKSHIIKRIRAKTITTEDSDIVETEVEMYDRMDALKTLAKFHNLTNTVRIEDWRSQAIADIRAGRVLFADMVRAFNDEPLVISLFELAGVSIE